jgi:hypothetical protein
MQREKVDRTTSIRHICYKVAD